MSDQSPFIWHELVTRDQDKCAEFYSQLLDWDIKQVDAGEFGTYTLFQKDGQDIAGMMNPTSDTPGQQAYWHSYLAVENIDKCVSQTEALGGTIIVPAHEVPDVGRICIIADPVGAIMHLIQPV